MPDYAQYLYRPLWCAAWTQKFPAFGGVAGSVTARDTTEPARAVLTKHLDKILVGKKTRDQTPSSRPTIRQAENLRLADREECV